MIFDPTSNATIWGPDNFYEYLQHFGALGEGYIINNHAGILFSIKQCLTINQLSPMLAHSVMG